MYSESDTRPSHQRQQWEPQSVVGLTNPHIGDVSCVGEARTYGRRCRRRVAMHKVWMARDILGKLADLGPFSAASSPTLWDAAGIMLCYQHTSQRTEVVSDWKARLLQYGKETKSRDHGNGTRTEPKSESTNESNGDQKDHEDHDRTNKQDSRGKQQRPQQEEKSRQNEERTKEREEATNQDENQKPEKGKRQSEAGERKQKRERQQKTPKNNWADAWLRYNAQWEAIESNEKQKVDPNKIPWPVKSGKREDVSKVSVREFFRNAPPVLLAIEPEEELYRIMTKENKRWHTDKIMSRFGRDILETSSKTTLDMIARLMIELWKEAKMQRKV